MAIIINLLFLIVGVYVCYLLIEMLKGLPPQAKQILYLLVALVAVVYALNILGFASLGFPVYRVG